MELNLTSLKALSSLKGYYRFESGALTTDSSGNSKTLTAISDPADDSAGKYGNSCAFDGNDGYYRDSDSDYAPTGSFSCGAWIKTSNSGVRQSIIIKASSTNYSFGLELNTDNKIQATLWQYAGGEYLVVTAVGPTLTDGLWHHVVMTYNGTVLTAYVDGVEVGSDNTTSGTWYTGSTRFSIGCRADNANYFTGSIDDAFFYNGYVLSINEINVLFNESTTNYLTNYRPRRRTPGAVSV